MGYSIRFDSRVTDQTRIEVVTEGILTRRLTADPTLEGVAMVIFDEFHERSLQADLNLAFCLDVQKKSAGGSQNPGHVGHPGLRAAGRSAGGGPGHPYGRAALPGRRTLCCPGERQTSWLKGLPAP